jgi:hypothetical protein
MRATWYILEDGRTVDPNDCAPDDAGNLRHKDGVAVAKKTADAYASRGVDLDKVGARDMAVAGTDEPAADNREIKAATGGKGYRTRSGKAG